ncbi:hypothetical protein BJ875DRAFT_469765 [Amylocarpus encephaloides]|uniref:2EXR domain-containing protein n=1 Tax=Amylocarpus encephaloides TaxID=45428 RepID=A0A9P7YCY4_9HELO|nr:hypothetical protein BJ875DRAFT_469765 [Amylocarpus encephaloides]
MSPFPDDHHFDPSAAQEETATSALHSDPAVKEPVLSMDIDLEFSTSFLPLPLTEFIFYPKLPVELQIIIWKYYVQELPPRFVSLSWSLKQILPIHQEPLSICSASRSVFQVMYEPIFASERGGSGPFIRANLDKDVLVFKYGMVVQDYGAYNTMRMREGVAERVKHWGQWSHDSRIFHEGHVPNVVETHGLYSLFLTCETITTLHLPPSLQEPKLFWKINEEKFKNGDYELKELNSSSAIDKSLDKSKWWKKEWKRNVPLMKSYGVVHPKVCPKLRQLKVELVYGWARSQNDK